MCSHRLHRMKIHVRLAHLDVELVVAFQLVLDMLDQMPQIQVLLELVGCLHNLQVVQSSFDIVYFDC